ncbi:MAG: response regulator [Campylobacterota bacterium]|nr:response regulator [Campylobacterota bacterium]
MPKTKHIKVTGEDDAVFMVDISKILVYSQALTLLYIETDNNTREETYDVLQHLFSKTILAKDGQEGLEAYVKCYEETENYPDIVITNVAMPHKDGIEMCQEIFDLHPQQMVLIASEHCKEEQFVELVRMNIHYFLLKPMEFNQLYTTLHDVCKICHNIKLTESQNDEMDTLNQALHQTITQLQQSVETERNSSKLKDEFFANMSHEIRTPMNAVMGLSHILLDTELNKKQYDYVSKIKKSSNLLLEIINDILDFSKIEAGKLDIEYIEFNINDILDNVSNIVNFKANEKGIELIFDIDKNVSSHVNGDSLRLSQVLINLMNNAIKFTEQGEIILKVTQLPNKAEKSILEFRVIDTGIGITPEQIDKLFQTFGQADDSTSRKYGGSGLGLTISKQLVEMMGGTIKIESEIGVGSQFIFTIQTEQQKEKRNYRLPSKDLMNKNVLLIDANEKTTKSLSDMLSYFHYTTTCISDYKLAESTLLEQDFDFICVNHKSIIECEEIIKRVECNTKVVVMKSDMDSNDEEVIHGVAISSYLTKPFTPQLVFSMILELYDEQKVTKIISDKSLTKKDLHTLTGSHIFIAEDNAINQTVMIALLEDTGIKTTILNNGQEVLEQLALHDDVELILMDINMPIMNGYDAVTEIRDNSKYDHIPIIALTASTLAKDIEKANEVGMVEHISKPINVNMLYTYLLKYIQPKSIQTEEEYALQNLKDFVEKIRRSINSFELYQQNLHLNKAIELIVEIKEEASKNNIELLYNTTELLENIFKGKENDFYFFIENYTKTLEEFIHASDTLKEEKEITEDEKNRLLEILNMNKGIASLNGDEDLYRTSLFTFSDIYRNSAYTLNSMVQSSEFSKFLLLTQEIKQASESISATSIYKIASLMESSHEELKSDLDIAFENYTQVCESFLDGLEEQ